MVLQPDESLGTFQTGDVFGLGRQFREVGVDDAFAVDPDAALVAVAREAWPTATGDVPAALEPGPTAVAETPVALEDAPTARADPLLAIAPRPSAVADVA